MRFIYSIIQFVPDAVRGEFVNVGAIVGSDETFQWEIVQVANLKRARAIQERPSSLNVVADFINHYGTVFDMWSAGEDDPYLDFDAEPEFAPTEEWLAELSRVSRSSVRVSRPLPVAAESLDEAIQAVSGRLLVDSTNHHLPFRRRTVAKRFARELYLESGLVLGETLFEEVVVMTKNVRETLDFAVVNGRALQVTQALSFDLPRQDDLAERIKAWAWSITSLRAHGGAIKLKTGRQVEVARSVDVGVVYVAPSAGHSSALDTARDVFADLSIDQAPMDTAQAVIGRGVRLLAEAQGQA